MHIWTWMQALIVLAIGWAVVAVAIRLFHTPLPRPSNLKTWGYWIARMVWWGFFLASGASGTFLVVYRVIASPGPVEIGTLLSTFLLGALGWMYAAMYVVFCYGFDKCLG